MNFARPLCIATISLATTFAFAQAPATPETPGVTPANMDKSVKPGDNFYRYANGAYLDRTEIPADRTGMSGFSVLADIVNKSVAALLAEAAHCKAASGTA